MVVILPRVSKSLWFGEPHRAIKLECRAYSDPYDSVFIVELPASIVSYWIEALTVKPFWSSLLNFDQQVEFISYFTFKYKAVSQRDINNSPKRGLRISEVWLWNENSLKVDWNPLRRWPIVTKVGCMRNCILISKLKFSLVWYVQNVLWIRSTCCGHFSCGNM